VVENVSDGEIVAEGADDQDYRSEEDGGEGSDAGAASSFTDALRTLAKHCCQRSVLPRDSTAAGPDPRLRDDTILEG
jgi:hypothetical protein